MAVTSLDIAVANALPPQSIYKVGQTAEAAGVFQSLFYATGLPGAAVAPTPGLAGAALTAYAGQIPFPAAVGGKNIHLIGMDAVGTVAAGSLVLCDRLWHNSGITITTTTGQTINSVAWPARDLNGSTNGVGVEVAIEVSATCGNGAVTNTTLTYTNEAGTGSRTATIASVAATATAGSMYTFQLQAGDLGVRSIQTLTLGTSYVSGTIHLVAFRRIQQINLGAANVSVGKDIVQLGMPRMYDNSVPFQFYVPSATTATTFTGQVVYTQA